MPHRTLLTLSLVVLIGLFVHPKTFAQEKVILRLAVPTLIGNSPYDEAYFKPFLDTHPEVNIALVVDDKGPYQIPSAQIPLAEHLNNIEAYTTSADVLYAPTHNTITIESTRAGYWFDLSSLVAYGPDLAQNNFYPPAWQAFRWDEGMWAMPTAWWLDGMAYNPAGFDRAGLDYPDENWSIQDFARAAIDLKEKNQNGDVVTLGCGCDETLIFYSLLRDNLIDSNGMPRLNTPEARALLEIWMPIREVLHLPETASSRKAPLQMGTIEAILNESIMPYTLAEMPGNTTIARVGGFGISATTTHPELAFELVRFLTQHPLRNFGSYPALRTVIWDNPFLLPDNQVIIDYALENAASGLVFQYLDYIFAASYNLSEKVDANDALEAAQAKIISNLELAKDWIDVPPLS